VSKALRAGMVGLLIAVGVGTVTGAGLTDPASAAAGSAAPRSAATRSAAPAPPVVAAVDARVDGTFAMVGQITAALRVTGERPGEPVSRRWILTAQSCAGSVCGSLDLRRQRSAGRYDTLVLTRVGVGSYAGSGSFYAGLRCRGRTYPRGELVPYRITLAVTQATVIQGIAFATTVAATYTNSHRIDRTICPIGPSHDAAVYTGSASPLPSPPTA
jgi:hypothetical protein